MIDEGIKFCSKKDYEKSVMLLEMALKKDPQNIYALYECAHVCYILEDYAKCLSCLQTLLKIEESKSFNDFDKHKLQQHIADAYYYSGYKSYAKEIYETLLAEKYENIWLFVNLGLIYHYYEDYETALTFFIKAYEIKPDDPDINIYIGAVYSKQEKYELALEFILHGEELGYKSDIYIYEEVSRIYYILENYEQSRIYAQKMIDLDSGYGEGYRRMGYALWGLKENSRVVENFQKAIGFDSAESYMYYFIVHSLIETDVKTTQRYAGLMKEKYPEDLETYAAQGLVFYYTKKYKKAFGYLKKIPESSYLYNTTVIYKICALYEMGKYKQVLEAYQELSDEFSKNIMHTIALSCCIELNQSEFAKEILDNIRNSADNSYEVLEQCCYFYFINFDKENTREYVIKSCEAAQKECIEPGEFVRFLADKFNGKNVSVGQLSNDFNQIQKFIIALFVKDKQWLVWFIITRLILGIFLVGYLLYTAGKIILLILP